MKGILHHLKPARRRRPAPAAGAALPANERVYAIGDIHGRLDLLRPLAEAIERDDAAASVARSTVILLGDLVDRGADSAGVVAFARHWRDQRPMRILAGNHEQMFLDSFDDPEVLRVFLRNGGRETLLSYGVPADEYETADLAQTRDLMLRHVPQADLAFIAGFEDWIRMGDYLFVHAGIRPGVALEDQSRADLLWIREPFLSYGEPHGPVIVHGHTIAEKVQERPNRIGIDTGAWRHGRLTALVLEGTRRRYIAAHDHEGGIGIEAWKAD